MAGVQEQVNSREEARSRESHVKLESMRIPGIVLGVFIYYIGLLIYLWSWQAVVVFVLYAIIMMIQVGREEKRLEDDFGDEYREYKKKTKKIIPFVW